MRLQLICCVALAILRLCSAHEAALQPAVHVKLGPGSFFQWLASILLPAPVTPETTSATIATTASHVQGTTTEPSSSIPTERECSSCRCGLINTERKIVGGQETRRHQYPWMAVLLLFGHFHCAGSLINDLYVLTAGHCVEGLPPELITVRLLEHNRSDSDALVLQRRAVRVKVHELYNPRSLENDIALIRLDQPVSLEAPMRPVCLPVYSSSFEGELGKVTGWGALREGGFAAQVLQEVDVLILSQSECRSSSYTPAMITDNMLCAGYLGVGSKDACSGDSGGPLHVLLDEQPGQYQLAGIVSWGAGCARPDSPGVYTRVNQYLRWIEANTPSACACMEYPEEDY
ncbi:trypsin [Drosophila virilis]|uniref:Peptidase S1 domain-containing protein n=1 Tax=Drosophila virilis TaxID=7244 RepID=B4LM49_DROVI|nr:transmembrane protease serine 6 [Drosophila virilis]EDW60927.1 uncharacterized protein Dvir_GJ21756 [Drosophila virilis]